MKLSRPGKAGDLTGGLIVVNTDAVQLQITVTMVSSSGVNPMFITNHFPELWETKER